MMCTILLARRAAWIFALVAASISFACPPAKADMIVMVQSVTVNAGSTDNPLDVVLTNTGPSDVVVEGFSFGISTANPGIPFTSATTATVLAPYIFGSDSFFGPEIDTANGASLTASDQDSTFLGVTVTAGSTVGLGHVLFDVDASVPPGVIPVPLDSFATSLSGPAGGNIPIDLLVDGAITVASTPASVPEPSTLFLASLGVLLLMGKRGQELFSDKQGRK